MWCSLTKDTTNFVLWWEILLNWIHICFSEKKDLFLCCYVASETILLNQTYVLLIYSLLKSFLRIYMKTWNLAFCFQCCLFILKLVMYKRKFYYLEFLFLIYELNAVVSMHSNVFYPATSTLKMLYANFFWARFVMICLLCKFFIH